MLAMMSCSHDISIKKELSLRDENHKNYIEKILEKEKNKVIKCFDSNLPNLVGLTVLIKNGKIENLLVTDNVSKTEGSCIKKIFLGNILGINVDDYMVVHFLNLRTDNSDQ